MKYYEETLQVCREFLSKNPHVDKVFEKQGKDRGFLYEYEQEERRLFFEISLKPAGSFLMLRAESGICADTDAFGITIQACQLCSDPEEPGILMVSPDSGYVTFLISSPIVELPVCEETLVWMHTCAFEKIFTCEGFLKMFAKNRLDPQLLTIPKRKEALLPENLNETLQFAVEVLTEDFAETGNATVNLLQSKKDLFFNEIRTKDGFFYEKISVDTSGCLMVSVRPAIQINRLEQGDLAPICNRLNCEQAGNMLINGLHAFSDDGFLWFSSAVSLWDGLIGIDAVKAIEIYALRYLDECMLRWRRLEEDLPGPELEETEVAEEAGADEIAELMRKYRYQEDEDPKPMITFGPADDESQEETSKPDFLPEAEPEPDPPAPMLKQVGTTTCWRWESEETEETIEIELDPALYADDDTSGTNEADKDKRNTSDVIDSEPIKPNSLDEAMQKHRDFKKRMQQLEERLKQETEPVTDGG